MHHAHEVLFLDPGCLGTDKRRAQHVTHLPEQVVPGVAGSLDAAIGCIQLPDEVGPGHIHDRDTQSNRDRPEIIHPDGCGGGDLPAFQHQGDGFERKRHRRHTERHRLGRRGAQPAAARRARLPGQQRFRARQVDRVGDVEQPKGDDGARGDRQLRLAHRPHRRWTAESGMAPSVAQHAHGGCRSARRMARSRASVSNQ